MSKRAIPLLLTALLCVVFAPYGFAFVPTTSTPAQAAEEPQLLYETAPPSQDADAHWQAFVALEGKDFTAAWNPVTQTPHRIQGKGLKIAGAVNETNVAGLVQDFVESKAQLLGADPASLRLVSQERHGARWYTDYQQTYQGLDVVGGRVHVRLTDRGTVTTFGSDFYQGIAISPTPALSEESGRLLAKQAVDFDGHTDKVLDSKLVVLPAVQGRAATYSLAYEVRLKLERDPARGREPALWHLYIDAMTGDVLKKMNDIRYDTVSGIVSGYIKPRYITDPDEIHPFADEYVDVAGYGQATTDQNGLYSLEAGTGGMRTLSLMLKGRWAEILDNSGPEAAITDSCAPGSEKDILWTSPWSAPSERNAYYHSWIVHNWIKTVEPAFTGMDRETEIFVDLPNYCNAYWDGSGITIGAGSGSCLNLGLFCDVLYHEYGHGIADMQYRPYAPSGAMHEAFADYTACTITNESYIGEGIYGPGTYFRNIDNTLKYPADLTGEVHDDSRILSGALWDLRTSLLPDVHLTDSLFHYARYGKADNFVDYYNDVIETDDDDGNLANGTPHYYQIVDAFGKHGIGPGLYISIAHVPLHDSEDSLAAFPVVATITSDMALDPASLLLYYSTGGPFTTAALLATGNPNEYSATVPHQAYGTAINYYLYAKADGRSNSATDPAGAPGALHTFRVGTDTTPPVITHTPLEDQPDTGWPATVTATVTDNLGLASVVLEYRKDGLQQAPIAMTRVAGTNDYQATFQVPASPGDVIEYRIVATDAASSPHTTHQPTSGFNALGIATATGFSFETGASGWTHSAPSGWTDQWHLSTQRNHTAGGSQSWKCGDTGSAPYANHLNALLETPWVQIGQNATLTFWYWIEAENYEPLQGSGIAWDGAALSLVDSTGKASSIDPVGGYPWRIIPGSDAPFTSNKPVYSGRDGWTMATFDLSRYQGRGKIRFKFGSDMAVGYEGWYIDDVAIWSQGALAGVDGASDGNINPGLPTRFALANALPNPTHGKMSISYAVPAPGSHVAIKVFDVRGRLASTLVDETKNPGRYTTAWDGTDQSGTPVAPGIYFLRMEARDFSAGTKVVLVR